MALLEIENVVAGYGIGPDILTGLSLQIEAERSYCIIGPNGAGKSTLLKVICGLVPPRRGSVVFDGRRRSTASRTDEILQRGICFVPQDRSLFPDMTITRKPADGRLHPQGPPRGRQAHRCGLRDVPDPQGAPGAARQDAFRRPAADAAPRPRLVLRPRIIMLDEPSLGLAPIVSQADIRLDERAEARRHHHHRRRAERPHGPAIRRLGLRPRPRQGWCSRGRRRPSSTIRASRSSISAGGARGRGPTDDPERSRSSSSA